ncbi:MAG: response regulator transcription factor [Microscillaceae bacterium]|nr:response regulator transcription factor [Microscillaceae bacterium]MDW8460753.1 response regulator transcription factor [Cytophagales bacterium]
MTRIALLDDHAIVRLGIKQILSRFEGIRVIADFGTTQELLNQMATLQPDLVLCDITMPDISGIDFTKKVKKEYPNVKVLILSTHKEEFHVLKAVEANADGFLHKDVLETELYDAIKRVMNGEKYYSQSVSQIIIQNMMNKNASYNLSAREREVLEMLVKGYSHKEIAEKLFISSKTVDNHRANILRKLNLRNNADLVRFSLENKLV